MELLWAGGTLIFLGILYATIAAFFFGVFILPRKASQLGVFEYQFYLVLTIPLVAILFILVSGARFIIPSRCMLLAILCGPLWTIGAIAYNRAADFIGVTRSTLIKNLGPILTTIYGVLIFREFTLDTPLLFLAAVIGSVLMFVATCVISKCTSSNTDTALAYQESSTLHCKRKYFVQGVLLASFTGFCFSAYTIPLRFALNYDCSAVEAVFWVSIGVCCSSIMFFWVTQKKFAPKLESLAELRRCFFAGFSWILAFCTATLAMTKIPMSISWSITNLCGLITLAFGVCLFKEIPYVKYKKEIVLGSIIFALGMLLLTYSVFP